MDCEDLIREHEALKKQNSLLRWALFTLIEMEDMPVTKEEILALLDEKLKQAA